MICLNLMSCRERSEGEGPLELNPQELESFDGKG